MHRSSGEVALEIRAPRADTRPCTATMPDPNVTPDRPPAPDEEPQVIPFRRRDATAGGSTWRSRLRVPPAAPPPPLDDLAKYEGGEQDDNYRHRMMVNLAALAVTVVLALVGIWLVAQIADMRKKQDCYLSGRRNCTPIDVKVQER
jgi:hypothetical protein